MSETDTFTYADIIAAQDNDLGAVQLVTGSALPAIERIAAKLAREVGGSNSDLTEELSSEGRLSLWTHIAEHDGDPQHGGGWLIKTVYADMLQHRVRLMNPGVSYSVANIFMSCLRKVGYDTTAAIRMATEEIPQKHRMSLAAAYAAAMAHDTKVSLSGTHTGEHLASDMDISEDEIVYKVGHGAALEALSVLQTYCTAREALSELPRSVEAVERIEDAVTLPADAETRRFILDAVAILRSYVGMVPADEMPDEDEYCFPAADAVRSTLDKMSDLQATILIRTQVDSIDNKDLAEELDSTPDRIKVSKRNARQRFHKLFPWASVFAGEKPALIKERNDKAGV